MTTTTIGTRDFLKATIRALAARGISIIGITSVPGADGSWANGERVYQLNDNGTGRVCTHEQVRELAAGPDTTDHAHVSVTTPDGCGAFCSRCGETLA